MNADEVTPQNSGSPVLEAIQNLNANESWARSVGTAGKHLAAEVLHPDNIAR